MLTNFKYDTADLREQDREHIIHPWIDLGTAKTREPMVIAESEGAHIYDSEGHKMLDGIGGMWCVNIGHAREEMAQAIADQVRRLCYYSPFGLISTPPSIEFGARLTEYAPGDLKHVFFTTGGSTAVDSALRFVQFYFNFIGQPQKKHIITREYAYHGSTYLSASVSGKPGDRGHLDFVTDTVHHLPSPNPYRRPDGMSEAEFGAAKVKDLEDKILELGPEKVACFIAEPLLASGGVIVPPKGYQKATREICRKYDVLYISDEVVTGFGRLGEIFASEPVFDIVPDIITCAKGLTSGYIPLGAFLLSDRLYERVTGEGAKGKFFPTASPTQPIPWPAPPASRTWRSWSARSCASACANSGPISRSGSGRWPTCRSSATCAAATSWSASSSSAIARRRWCRRPNGRSASASCATPCRRVCWCGRWPT